MLVRYFQMALKGWKLLGNYFERLLTTKIQVAFMIINRSLRDSSSEEQWNLTWQVLCTGAAVYRTEKKYGVICKGDWGWLVWANSYFLTPQFCINNVMFTIVRSDYPWHLFYLSVYCHMPMTMTTVVSGTRSVAAISAPSHSLNPQRRWRCCSSNSPLHLLLELVACMQCHNFVTYLLARIASGCRIGSSFQNSPASGGGGTSTHGPLPVPIDKQMRHLAAAGCTDSTNLTRRQESNSQLFVVAPRH